MNNPSAPAPLLRCRGIVKRFGSFVANDRVDFDIQPGEVHALVGENGAGKSTLMSMLYGLLRPDAGGIEYDGKPVVFRSCADAIAAGIGMVFQHYLLVERFSVAENVMLGRELGRFGWIDTQANELLVRDIAQRYGFALDAATPVERLGVGARQQVELLKVLERNPRVVILDEPTAALSPLETESLFAVIERIRDEGRAVVFISHKLKEVLAISDRITVLRRGRIVASMSRGQATESRIAAAMIGSEAFQPSGPTPASRADTVARHTGAAPYLEIRHLRVAADEGSGGVADVSVEAQRGEIIGIAGVEGNGQLEFAEAVYGLRPATQGSIVVGGADLTGWTSSRRRAVGVRYVPFDRQREGLVLDFDGAENVLLGNQRLMRRRLVVDHAAASTRAQNIATSYRVHGFERRLPLASYSGGTQQKFLLGRELDASAGLIIACSPTRGVDLGAAELIYERLRALRDGGACVLLVSYDLDEIRAIADRVLVFFRGRVSGHTSVAAADDATLGRLMGGLAS